MVPVRMRLNDYVEASPEGQYVLYEANGGVLATGRTEGVLELPRATTAWRFQADAPPDCQIGSI